MLTCYRANLFGFEALLISECRFDQRLVLVLNWSCSFDQQAKQTGSIIVPSCGFDSVPSDIVAYLGAKTLAPLTVDKSTSSVSVAGGLSGGTLSSALTMIENVPKEDLKASSEDWYLSPVKGVKSVPISLAQSAYFPDTRKTVWGGLWMMAPYNTAVIQRTVGLQRLEESQSPENSRSAVKYGPNFKYAEFFRTPGRISAVAFTMAFGLVVAGLWFLPPVSISSNCSNCALTTYSFDGLRRG